MKFSLRCLMDFHEWTTEAVVIRGQSWEDGRARCRRCATPKPDLSRRTFLMGATAVAIIAATGPLEILAPVAPGSGLLGIVDPGTSLSELSAITRRIYLPRLVAQLAQPTPLFAAFEQRVNGGRAIAWPLAS